MSNILLTLTDIKDKLTEEEFNILYDGVVSLQQERDDLEHDYDSVINELDECECEVNRLQNEVNELEIQLENRQPASLVEIIDEILKEHYYQYSYRNYDTYEKIIDTLDRARRYC